MSPRHQRRPPGQGQGAAPTIGKYASTGPAVAPATVTDRTCLAVLGVPWRTLRGWLDERGVRYGRIGRRPVVRVDVVLRELDGAEVGRALDDADVIELATRRGRR